jgi:type I restriction enzyme S subunit
VEFRFPKHEKSPRVDSPLGRIPKGWAIRRLDEALSFESGRTIKKEDRESGDTPVFGANGIIGGTASEPMASHCIVMGKIGSCGALHRSHKACWVTNNAFLISPAAIESLELGWQVLLSIDFRRFIGGAANPYMPLNNFGHHEVIVPAIDIQTEFERRAAPLRRLVESLSERVENLRRMRNLLLPRLLSGQIALDTAQVEEVAA